MGFRDNIEDTLDLISNEVILIKLELKSMGELLLVLQEEVQELVVLLGSKPHAVSMELQFKGEKPGMPGQETDTQTIPCTAIENDAAGNPVTLNPANVSWSIADPSIAQLTQNPDGSATFKALKVGSTTVTCTDTGETPPVVGTDTLIVVAGQASSMVLHFGTPA